MTAVLLAHRVAETIQHQVGPFERNTITLDDFDRVLSRSELKFSVHPDRLFQSRAPGGVLLTFDDGYATDVHRWLRLIEERELYTVIFVTTGFVDGTVCPYEETLAQLLSSCKWFKPNADSALVDVSDFEKKQSQYETLRMQLFNLTTEEKNEQLAELARINNIALPQPSPGNFLTWKEVIELDKHPLIVIGAHTESHPKLTRLPRADAYAEIVNSKLRLEEKLRHEVSLFSYPYGANNRMTRRIVKQAGFRLGFGTKPGSVWKYTNKRRVPRIDIKNLVPNGVIENRA